MSRPSDWHVLDLPGDPTPGEPYGIRTLARSAASVAADAQQAHSAVRALAGDGAVLSWVGAAGEVFRGALHDFPTQLDKLHRSYEQANDALAGWAGTLGDAQAQPDRALVQGRQARAEIDALAAQLASARADASSAASASQRLGDVPAGGPPPDPAQVRAATAAASAASSRVSSLDHALSDAHSRLSAAKRMAEQARELRKDGARRTRHALEDASDAGIQPKSRWQRFKDAVAKAWHITVKIATVVAIVVAVAALFVGGPLVLGVLFVASAVLLADALIKYANGEGSLWEVGLAALGVIPGGRLLNGLGKAIGTFGAGERALAAGARGLAGARGVVRGMTGAVRDGLGRAVERGLGRMPVGDAGRTVVGRARPLPDLSDIPFVKGTDEWAAEVSRRYPGLTPGEARGIYDYTTNAGYDAMNGQLRAGAHDAAVQERIDRAVSGLGKLPTVPGTTFRGTHLPDGVFEAWRPGATVSDPAFVSTSVDPAVARSFGDMDFVVHGTSGVDVQPLSHFGREGEVLFRPGQPFQVLSRDFDPATGRWRFVLQEVPR